MRIELKKAKFFTPILFLVFNRPDVTQKVFNQIKKNRPKELYIAIDGPRNAKDMELLDKVKRIVKNIDWQCDAKYLVREKNLGCKVAVSSAIDWFFKNVERGIILEDDCLPNDSFFLFTEVMLNKYEQEKKIMMISGTNYLIDYKNNNYDYLFSKYFTIWGWATWKDRWQKYDVDIRKWEDFKKQSGLKNFINNYFSRKYFENSLDMIAKNQLDTWDVQWVFTCLINDGFNIIPRVNLISNIGINGLRSREKTESHYYKTLDLDVGNLKHPPDLSQNFAFDKKLDKDKTIKDFLRSSFYLFIRSLPFYRKYKEINKK